MKHFVILAALLTSLSVFAQLPYNPDANNDGHIGAFDLTSLLSVYSGNFSNGLLGEGTGMAELTVGDDGSWAEFSGYSSATNSWVVDLSLLPSYPPDQFFNGGISIAFDPVANGTTLTILKPSDWVLGSPGGQISTYASTVNGDFFGGQIQGLHYSGPKCVKFVFWNGEWLSLYPDIYYFNN